MSVVIAAVLVKAGLVYFLFEPAASPEFSWGGIPQKFSKVTQKPYEF